MTDLEKISQVCDTAKHKIRDALVEFVKSDIHEDNSMKYFGVVNIMTVAIKDAVNMFTPEVGPHEFCGFLSRLSDNYLMSCELINKCCDSKDEEPDETLNLSKENFNEVLTAIRSALKNI